MLFRVILLPTALSAPPASSEAASFFYPAAISMLQDLLENCVLLIDPRVADEGAPAILGLQRSVQGWPEQFKIRAQRILTTLQKKKRFQVAASEYVRETRCAIEQCQDAVGVGGSIEGGRLFVIGGGACLVCCKSVLPGAQVASIENYGISEFQSGRRKRAVVLSDGEWASDRFEQDVLVPVLRYAEVLKLYDRMVTGKIEMREAEDNVEFSENYKLTIKWIVSVFSRESICPSKQVEIYSAVSVNVDNKQLKKLESCLRSFVKEIASETGAHISLFLKEETQKQRMPHGRYLITDKLGLLVERGFDLLWDDRAMKRAGLDPAKHPRRLRDVMVTICPDPGVIETSTSRLRNASIVS
jgi:hypothetical protein